MQIYKSHIYVYVFYQNTLVIPRYPKYVNGVDDLSTVLHNISSLHPRRENCRE